MMPNQSHANMDSLNSIGGRLLKKAEAQVNARQDIEKRWLEDIRQYHGRYNESTESRLTRNTTGSSRIYVNLTRPKCDVIEARISEILFPSEDINWGIEPTPQPNVGGGDAYDPELWDYAERAARAMQRTITDQLAECDYHDVAKAAIHDAVVMGTGILKGPVIHNRATKHWVDQGGVQMLEIEYQPVPIVERVNPWDFFPDMSARTLEEAEFIFERRFITRKALRGLAQHEGYFTDSIRAVLQSPPERRPSNSDYRQRLRDIIGVNQALDETTYELWQYNGPITKDEAEVLGINFPDDPLIGMDVMVEFIGTQVIRAELHPLDTQDVMYSVFVLYADDSVLFGYGTPYVLRAAQTAINAAWRMMLDNSALSVGPQIVVNPDSIRPADGVFQLAPRKVWLLNDLNRSVSETFKVFNIDSHQPELMGIFEVARRLVEQESNISELMHGDIGQGPKQTATGLSMAMNAANTVLRGAIKRWDDKITKPLLQRFYDYNMQYTDNESIKGDFQVLARGSTALMVKETQGQALMQLINIAQSELVAPLIKFPALLRKIVETFRLSPDDLVYTDEEIERTQQQQAAMQQQQVVELQAQQQQEMAAQAQPSPMDSEKFMLKSMELASKERMRQSELASRDLDRNIQWAQIQDRAEQAQLTNAMRGFNND